MQIGILYDITVQSDRGDILPPYFSFYGQNCGI